MKMNCPICRLGLESTNRYGITLKYCPVCDVFCARSAELEMLLEHRIKNIGSAREYEPLPTELYLG